MNFKALHRISYSACQWCAKTACTSCTSHGISYARAKTTVWTRPSRSMWTKQFEDCPFHLIWNASVHITDERIL